MSMHKIAHAARVSDDQTISERLFRRIVANCAAGQLSIALPGSQPICLVSDRPGVSADIEFRTWRGLLRVFVAGDIGFANSYCAGEWNTSDLTGLLTWATQNEVSLAKLTTGSALLRFMNRIRHWRRENSRANSRRNIAAHYDLGNDFYARWLDQGMNYSSGIFETMDESLETAQVRKIDRACDLLELSGGESVLEIGCGWGAAAEKLTATHGCKLTGLTLSKQQREYTRKRLGRAGCLGSADIRLQDYRDVHGRFDRVVSIEMLEAVGEAYWPQYFSKIRDCLAPGGTAVIQAITISAERYSAYRERPDFIQLEIFPGGALPTGEIVAKQAAAAGLRITATDMFAMSYARTLAEWRRRFNASWCDIEQLGFDESFRRSWNYYLSYCEAGFSSNALDVGIYQLRRV